MAEHFISRADAESDLLACATYLAETIESADGHAEGISAVVPRYLAKGDVDLAAELANTVDDPFTRDRLLIHVAEKCAEVDDDEYALQLLEAIEEPALQAEGYERIGMLEAGKGNFEAATKIAEAMAHPDYVQSTIAVKQFANGDTDSFRATLGGIEFPAARVSAYTGIAHARLADKQVDGVDELLESAAVDAAEIEHDEERIRALVEIGTLFHDFGNNGKAIETFDKARDFAEQLDNVHRDSFLAAVSVGFLRAGSQDLADRALDLVEDKTQLATCLVGHARHYWGNEQKEDALESIEEAHAILKSQKETETRNSKERFKLFGTIAAQFAHFDKSERAIEIAESIADDTTRMTSLSQIAVIFASRGEEEFTRQAINAIPEEAQQAFALIGVADQAEKREERAAAVAALDQAAEKAEAVPQMSSRASAYIETARRYAKFEEADKFDAAIAKAIEAITSIKDESIKVASLIELDTLVEGLNLDIAAEDLGFLKTILKDVPFD
jgi:tetratricopeptide (TPR) repeat protein